MGMYNLDDSITEFARASINPLLPMAENDDDNNA